jgi:RNA polymerase sigma-70 factor (ECF subfamily)
VYRKLVENQESFLALLTQHRKILHKVAGAYCRSAMDREDLTAEMTAALWKSFASFDERRSFSTWMYRIALNVAISFSRSQERRSKRDLRAGASASESSKLDEEPDDRVDLLNEFIAGLGDLDKALMLLHLDEHSYKSIGAVLGLTETNVATKLGRLKARARVALTAKETAYQGDL